MSDLAAAYLCGVACMMHCPPGTVGREPAWLGNIECAADGCRARITAGAASAAEDWVYMALHWWVPAANRYMDDRAARLDEHTDRLLGVLAGFGNWSSGLPEGSPYQPIVAVARRLKKGARSS